MITWSRRCGQWLTRKQKETRRGRALTRLVERSALWNSSPSDQHLPAWWEWFNILLLTRKRDWTDSQQKMMRQATAPPCSRHDGRGPVAHPGRVGIFSRCLRRQGPGPAQSFARCRHRRGARSRSGNGAISPLGRSAAAEHKSKGQGRWRPPHSAAHQPGLAAGGCRAEGISRRLAAGRQPDRVAGAARRSQRRTRKAC